MSIRNLPLILRATVVFDVDVPQRHVVVAINDACDTDAAAVADEWARGEFTLDDLFWSLVPHAEVTVTENDGDPEHYTGESFAGGGVLRELDGVDPTSVTFTDLEPAATPAPMTPLVEPAFYYAGGRQSPSAAPGNIGSC